MKRTAITIVIIFFMVLSVSLNSTAWSNGGNSDDITNPDYGTHDWVAEKALAMLPASESQYIQDNLDYYLYGTELPDNYDGIFDDGIGDTFQHHVYFDSDGVVTDDASANRADAMFDDALSYLQNEDYENASKYAGAMTHYIADLGVFGHVMGSTTFWGTETHHSDYESYVLDHQADFNSYIVFDGTLVTLSAYNATIELAYDTTFDDSGAGRDCLWMDAEVSADPVDPVDPPPVQAGDPTKLKINEMEQGPAGEDSGYEWVELYNPTSSSIGLAGCQLKNNDGNYKTLSGTVPANGYFVYTFPTQWLDNVDEGVILLYNSNMVDQTPIKDDGANDGNCWARVPNGHDTNSDSDWSYVASTKGSANPSTRAYDWADPDFKDRAGENLNLAVNLVADVLHTLAIESGYTGSGTTPVDDPETPVDADDTDADGMPDVWEIEQFGDLYHDGTGDLDGDGTSDLDEYTAGTDPKVDEAEEADTEPIDGDNETPGFEFMTMMMATTLAFALITFSRRRKK